MTNSTGTALLAAALAIAPGALLAIMWLGTRWLADRASSPRLAHGIGNAMLFLTAAPLACSLLQTLLTTLAAGAGDAADRAHMFEDGISRATTCGTFSLPVGAVGWLSLALCVWWRRASP